LEQSLHFRFDPCRSSRIFEGDSITPGFFSAEASYHARMNETRVFYQWMRMEVMDQWWHWLILTAVIASILSFVVYWYRRDWVELPRALGWTLLVLRVTAFVGIAIFFMDLQRRSEQKVVRPSRLAVLVDTSLSMSLPLKNDLASSNGQSRMEATVEFLKNSSVTTQLQSRHDLVLYRFDQTLRPTLIASLSKPRVNVNDQSVQDSTIAMWRFLGRIVWFGTVIVSLSVIGLVISMSARLSGSKASHWPYGILFSVVSFMIGTVVIGTAILRGSELPVASLWQFEPPPAKATQIDSKLGTLASSDMATNDVQDWSQQLLASGVETRLGDAVQAILEQERGSPLAGIVILTDGQSNAGVEPTSIVGAAAANGVPIYAIGVGSPDDPINVRVVDIEAPKRVYPGDRFRVTALIQASGLAGKKCSVQLRRKSAGAGIDNFAIEEETQIELGDSEAMLPVTFDVKPREMGAWTYDVKLLPPGQDTNLQDNQLDTEIRVVEPRSTVLVVAGGPTREYQFVRNLLFRDKTVQSHVLLQTGGPGMSQEADKLLTEFPSTLAEMSEYDCVIAFDADWMSLSVSQIEVLEKWVAQQAGGLVLILGPVASPRWTGTSGNGDRRAELMRNLSPIVLNGRGSRLVSMGRFESETVWPLKFPDGGRNTDFLHIVGDPEESQRIWSNFSGVYSFYASYEPKPGSLPVAYFSDPSTSLDGKFPVYIATQFYGAGRVVAQGSGEIWRLRQLSDDYFDTYYTKLVRWAAQSRLLRDSDRGLLLLDKQQALVGEQINVRAVLRDEQFQPLVLSNVSSRLLDPSGINVPLELVPLQDPGQLGTYIGQFLAKQTGSYEVRLPVGNLAEQQVLSQQVTVRVPTREIQRPQRNDPLLQEITNKTGGYYFPDFAAALDEVNDPNIANPTTPNAESASASAAPKIVSLIGPRDQTQFLPGAPDRDFQLRLMGILMALIGTALSLEWFLRRLSKLA
jgi:von Willebrand factor type A domain